MGIQKQMIQRQIDYMDGMKSGMIIGVIIGMIAGYAAGAITVMVQHNDRGINKNIRRGTSQKIDGVLRKTR